MATLHLTLKKKWFDMILSGEKKEEYREIKQYWIRRLIMEDLCYEKDIMDRFDKLNSIFIGKMFRKYNEIVFTHGYAKTAPQMIVECKGIRTGTAKSQWSDGFKGRVFIIELGKIIGTKNCK